MKTLLLSVLIGLSMQEEMAIQDFLNASQEAQELSTEGKQCRVVCFPCCYAPRTCEVFCKDKKEDQ